MVNGPPRQGTVYRESPNMRIWDGADQYLDVVMPAPEVRLQLFSATGRGP